MNPDTVARVLVCYKAKQFCCDLLFIKRMHDMHGVFILLLLCNLWNMIKIWRSDHFRDSALASTHALVFYRGH